MYRIPALTLFLGTLAAACLFPTAGHSQTDSLAWRREVDRFGRDFIASARRDGPAGIRAHLSPSSAQSQQVEAEVRKMQQIFPTSTSESLELVGIDGRTTNGIPEKRLTYNLSTPTQGALLRLVIAEPNGRRYVEEMQILLAPAWMMQKIDDVPEHDVPSRKDPYEMQLAGGTWRVTLEIPGFDIGEEQESPDGRAKMMEAVNRRTGIMLSLYIEREKGMDTPEACRDLYWKRMRRDPRKKTDVQFTSQAPLALARYTIENAEGMRVMQRNVNAYYGQKGSCVDLHLSKPDSTPGDDALFDTVLRSVRIVSDESQAAPAGSP